MSDTIKGAIIGAVITTIGSLLIFFLGNFSTQATLEKSTVETLSEYFNSIDEEMSYKQALQTLREESEQKDEEIKKLNQQNSDFKSQISNTPNFEFKNASLIQDGLKIQDNVDKSVIIIGSNNYYSEEIINKALKNKLSYDYEQNVVFYNPNGKKVTSETKIDLFETNALYDGACYRTYLPSDGETFSMGSDNYNSGFVIYDDHSLFGEGDGYALFDLQGKYSKMIFDVGRTNEYEKQDVTLKVYQNNVFVEEYSLNSQSPPIQLELDLNYANNMKLEITGGTRVKYGFTNVILCY